MARSFLITGTMAWDRVLYIDTPISPGARVKAALTREEGSDLPAGRLGGGAANAASALINAGHRCDVYAPVGRDDVGDLVLETAQNIGIGTAFVSRIDIPRTTTLILIDPAGERTILGMVPDELRELDFSKIALVPPALHESNMSALQYDGIFIRSRLPGSDNLIASSSAYVLAHWPLDTEDGGIDAHTLVGSFDDLCRHNIDPYNPWPMAVSQTLGRLENVIITNGAKGGVVHTADGSYPYTSPTIDQIDATGAGDCFAAGLLDALSAGASLQDALNHAANWGAITASRKGSACASKDDVYPPYNTHKC